MTGETSGALFYENVLHGIPSMVLILDADARVRFANRAIVGALGLDASTALGARGGDALGCTRRHDVPEGCGQGPYCKTECVIRQGIKIVMSGGEARRQRVSMMVERGGGLLPVNVLLTATPMVGGGETLALVTVEDISDLIRLQSILPICAHCKKIRNDADYWESVEQYLTTRVDVSFSHGFCPECSKKYYGLDPEAKEEQSAQDDPPPGHGVGCGVHDPA